MRYQNGTIEEVATKRGIIWFIRFTNPDGSRPRVEVGTKAQFPTKAKASRAAQHLRDEFNSTQSVRRTFGDVISRYEREEMPGRYSTKKGYQSIHKHHITPRWEKIPLESVKAELVRAWLMELPLAGKTKGNIHGQMKVLFRFAMLWEWVPFAANPMSSFTIPGSSKRKRKPRVINPAQFRALIKDMPIQERTMIIGAYLLGLRVSELFGLKWGDFDHYSLAKRVQISRAVVDGHVGPVKTEGSEAGLSLHASVNDAFLLWRKSTPFNKDSDWVFADPGDLGELPLNSSWMQRSILVPAGKRLGLDFSLGWHTFRHSYKVLLERTGADITVQRDLMRHSDVHTTTQVYGEVEFDRMRDANNKAVELAFTDKS